MNANIRETRWFDNHDVRCCWPSCREFATHHYASIAFRRQHWCLEHAEDAFDVDGVFDHQPQPVAV